MINEHEAKTIQNMFDRHEKMIYLAFGMATLGALDSLVFIWKLIQ